MRDCNKDARAACLPCDGIIGRRWVVGAGLGAMASAACGQITSPLNVNPRDFGARGDGRTDDAPALQDAIDAVAQAGGGTVTIDPGIYLLRYRPSEDGDGASGLTMRSGVLIEGVNRDRCILKLADDQMGPGTYARMIASKGEIKAVRLRRFSIDGNRRGQGRFGNDLSGGAVLLGWKGRCIDVTVEDIVVRDVVGQGIMLQGSIGSPARNLRIVGNLVERTSFIGIQCSQFDGLVITDNQVKDCHDNGIDIYGDDTIGHSTVSTSHNAVVTGNTISRCSIGVFFETVADSIASRNVIADCRSAGVRINRIHGEPRNLTVEFNRISGTPTGVAMSGETGGVVIRGNTIRGFGVAGIEFGYNVSRVTATANRFIPETRTTPIVLGTPTVLDAKPEERLIAVHVAGNRVSAGHDPSKLFVNRYRSLIDVEVGRFIRDPA